MLVFLQVNSNGTEFSEALLNGLPFSATYWIPPDEIPSFNRLLLNFYFEDPDNITIANLPEIDNVSGLLVFLRFKAAYIPVFPRIFVLLSRVSN